MPSASGSTRTAIIGPCHLNKAQFGPIGCLTQELRVNGDIRMLGEFGAGGLPMRQWS